MSVLHTLRCMGASSLPRIAEAAGISDDDTEAALLELAIDGLVTFDTGPFGGWSVTAAGKAADLRRVAQELDAAGTRDLLTKAFARFMVLNPELLDLCSAWQLRPGGGTHDARVLEQFVRFHQRAADVVDELAAALERFGHYRLRLGLALDRARAGRTEFLTDDMSSYHGVWFQLHEDQLVTLGIPR